MSSQDTEITLGTGKMLVLFFGLVALCGVFFGLGFSLGRNSGRPSFAGVDATQASGAGLRSSATKTTNTNPPQTGEGLTFYKSVEQKDPNAQLAGNGAAKDATAPAPAKTAKDTPDESAPPNPATPLA